MHAAMDTVDIFEEMLIGSHVRLFTSKRGGGTSQPVFIVDPETASIDTLNPGSSVSDCGYEGAIAVAFQYDDNTGGSLVCILRESE